jgi:NAD(P)-dependent dehydrogenase (short-subunit alcohol dehydrogenase family)
MAARRPEAALVTGALGGIGSAVSDALEARGYAVARSDLRGEHAVDVADSGAVAALIDRVEGELGPVTVLVNCAGFAQEIPLEEIGDDDWQRMLHVHLGGTYNTCRVLGPRMRERGRGSIVNISSELALTGSETMPHYCAAKGAIVGLTKALALELAPQVRVNSVAPGPTDTPLLTDLWRGEEYLRTLPVPRLATPREIGETVAFLASEDATYITAQVVSPNSGTVI